MPESPQRRNPFQRPEPTASPRIKVLLWGPTGTLKTRTALQFPAPVVIDLERGTERYAAEFQFDVLPPSTPEEILEAVRWVRDSRHEYRTLVIDPITLYWAALQRKWSDIFLVRLQGRKSHHHEFFELGPREWSTIKAEFNALVRTALQADVNLVLTAHDAAQYDSAAGGEMMRKVGDKPDCEKNLERVFDIVLRTERTNESTGPKFWATTVKDRTAKLPARFELRYETIAQAAGLEAIARASVPRATILAEQVQEIREAFLELKISEAVVYDRLQAYGVARVEDLSVTQALAILAKLRVALEKKRGEKKPSVEPAATAVGVPQVETSSSASQSVGQVEALSFVVEQTA